MQRSENSLSKPHGFDQTSSVEEGNSPTDIFSNINSFPSFSGLKEFVPQSLEFSRGINHVSEEKESFGEIPTNNYHATSEAPFSSFPGSSLFKTETTANFTFSKDLSSQKRFDIPTLFACDACGQEFLSEQALVYHANKCAFGPAMVRSSLHAGQQVSPRPNSMLGSHVSDPAYTCYECRAPFLSLQEFLYHVEYSGHQARPPVKRDIGYEHNIAMTDYAPPRVLKTTGPAHQNIAGPTYYGNSNRSRDFPSHSFGPTNYPMEPAHMGPRGGAMHPMQPSGARYTGPLPMYGGSQGPIRPTLPPMAVGPPVGIYPQTRALTGPSGYGLDPMQAGRQGPARGPFVERSGIIHFSGISKKDCLTGGCGWCLLDEQYRVLTQGSCYVVQNFPSQIRLEFEALLNGLKTAMSNGLSRVIIAGTSAIVVSFIAGGSGIINFLSLFKSVQGEIIDLTAGVGSALRSFRECRAELVSEADNAHCARLAEKALHAFQKKKKKEINRIVFTDYGTKKAGAKESDGLLNIHDSFDDDF